MDNGAWIGVAMVTAPLLLLLILTVAACRAVSLLKKMHRSLGESSAKNAYAIHQIHEFLQGEVPRLQAFHTEAQRVQHQQLQSLRQPWMEGAASFAAQIDSATKQYLNMAGKMLLAGDRMDTTLKAVMQSAARVDDGCKTMLKGMHEASASMTVCSQSLKEHTSQVAPSIKKLDTAGTRLSEHLQAIQQQHLEVERLLKDAINSWKQISEQNDALKSAAQQAYGQMEMSLRGVNQERAKEQKLATESMAQIHRSLVEHLQEIRMLHRALADRPAPAAAARSPISA